jgi:Scaffold protein Nfu/NifU N terminal
VSDEFETASNDQWHLNGGGRFSATFMIGVHENWEWGGYNAGLGSMTVMGFEVVEVQQTPNPNAAKFMLDREVSPQPTSFFNAAQADGHPLAKKLFAIPGVTSLLLLGDFVTVNKDAETPWKEVTTGVKRVLETMK